MAWDDRLQELAYTSPKGKRYAPKFEDLEQAWSKKTESTEFAAVDRTLVRDFGNTGRTFPLRLFFSGPDCDKQAATFCNALRERGFGKLEHPLEGLFFVVPVGTITRRDDLATAANVVALDVEFQETSDIAPPSPRTAASTVATARESAAAKLGEETARDIPGPSVTAPANLAADMGRNLESMIDGLRNAIQAQPVAKVAEITARVSALENNLAELVTAPAALATSILESTQLILTAPERIRARLSGAYRALADLFVATISPSAQGPDAAVIYAGRRLQAAALVMGVAEASAAEPWAVRSDAVTAAVDLQAVAARYFAWTEAQDAALGVANANGSDADIQALTDATAGGLVQQSFDLAQERALVTDRARAVVDLVAEVYQDLSRLDDFIATNGLTGAEILEVPKGRRVVYFIE